VLAPGLEVLGGVFSQWLDPSSPKAGLSSKMIVDATGPERLTDGAQPDMDALLGQENITDAAFPCEGNPAFCVVNATPDEKDLIGLLDAMALIRCRLMVCVDEDIDIHDGRQVLWAIATRFQPADDAIIGDSRMIIDARKRDGWTARRATLPT